jgi:hypothetical protein
MPDGIVGVYASGGPAGGQTFEKFDKQVASNETTGFLLHIRR